MKKMNKKGFTLIELLAVIIILAVLMLLAVPQVLKLQNKAKINAFRSQAETIYKAAQQQASAESNPVTCYSRSSATATNATINGAVNTTDVLELQGNKKVFYKIKLDGTTHAIKSIAVYDSGSQYGFYKNSDTEITDIDSATDSDITGTMKTSAQGAVSACTTAD